MNIDHDNDDLREFESELRKLKPIRFSNVRKKISREIFSGSPSKQHGRFREVRSRLLTLSLGVLIGAVLGGGLVFFLDRAKESGAAVAVQSTASNEHEIAPITQPVAEPIFSRRGDFPRATDSGPFGWDTIIAEYEAHNRRFAGIAKMSLSSPAGLPRVSSDPDSLLELRKKIKM